MKKQVRWVRLVLAITVAGIALGVLLVSFFGDELFPEYSPAQRGAKVAQKAGCFSCHGQDLDNASPNPTRGKPTEDFSVVPSMFDRRHSLDELREWIEDGVSSEKLHSGAFMLARESRLLTMPAFGNRLSAKETDDLMAYVMLRQYSASISSVGVTAQGEQLARQHACFTCHGELGQGGVMNPGSLKSYIPGFFGQDFRALTQNGDHQDVIEWIENGASEFFLNQGFLGFYPGRFFSERQAIQMPAYKDLLTPEEIGLVANFLLELLSRGPLTAHELHTYRPIALSGTPATENDVEAVTSSESPDDLFSRVSRILVKNCVKCHGPSKQKSGYRLDTRRFALRGGEIAEFMDRPAIVPGTPSDSGLITFVEAHEEDLDNEIYPMPPAENPRLSKNAIEVLKSWIAEGASWPEGYRLTPETEDD